MFLVFLRCRLYYYYYYFIYIVLLLLPSQTKHSTVFSFKKNPYQVKLLRYTHPPIYHSIKLLYSRNAQNVYLFKQVTTFFSYYERAICPTRQQPCTKYRHRQAGFTFLYLSFYLESIAMDIARGILSENNLSTGPLLLLYKLSYFITVLFYMCSAASLNFLQTFICGLFCLQKLLSSLKP